MKNALPLGLLPLVAVVVVIFGCTVDLGRLRSSRHPEVGPDVAADQRPGDERGIGHGLDASSPVVDVPTARLDGTSEVGDAKDSPTAFDLPPESVTEVDVEVDVEPDDAWSSSPDLPPPLDLAEPGPDVTMPSPDSKLTILDVATPSPDSNPPPLEVAVSPPDLPPPGLEVSAGRDTNPDTSDVPAKGDLSRSVDSKPDVQGLTNGSACSSAGQCQSGFCVGSPGRCCNQSCASVCYQANQCATGTCAPTQGTITCSDTNALCGLAVNDPANVGEWSFQTNMQVGDLALGSDPHTLSAVPAALAGAPWIRPSRLSKSVTTSPLVSFSISSPADVYVGVDTRLSVPSWMSGWEDSGLTISYVVISTSEPSSTVTQRLLRARFPAGNVSLGALACTVSSSCSMYLTIMTFADRPGGPAPTCR